MLVFIFSAYGVHAETALKYGGVSGRIVNEVKETLPGASIYIKELQTGVISDINGFYTLPHLPAGKYTLHISYVGYKATETPIFISENKVLKQDIVMNEGVTIEEVVVNGVFEGQRKALNMQKNGMGIVNVVSADQVGKFPDSNIGDALKRINGINVQYDQGEARFGQVRGTSADLTSVSVNGNRMPSAEGGTRNVQLDLIPADMVQTIEVNKVVTSDMDGDAIGGAINLVTKNSPYKRIISATAGSGYNRVSERPQLNLGLTYGDRFLNNKLGLLFSGSYQYAPGGSDNVEFKYEEHKGEVQLKEAQVRQYYVTRERQSYSLSADYQFKSKHKISLKGIYNRRNDWENRYRLSYKKLNGEPGKQSIVLQTKGGKNDVRNARLERQQTMDFTLDGNHQLGKLIIDWAGSFARATEDRPNERYFGISLKGKQATDYFENLSFNQIHGKFPYANQPLPSVDLSKYPWGIDEITNSNQNINEDEWKARINLELPLWQGKLGGKLKFGAKFTDKSKEKKMIRFDYTDDYLKRFDTEWSSYTNMHIRNGFMPGNRYPIHTPFVDKKYIGHLDLSSLKGEQVLEESSGNYQAKERISSGYIRLDQKLGKKLNAVLGLRVEHTYLNYEGYNWVVDEEENESLTPTGHQTNHYTNWLPSVLLKFSPHNNCNLRLSFTQTLARPKYSDLTPCVNYNLKDEEASIGNAYLKPTTSYNFDLSGDYYFKSIGMMSAGLFYKEVKDMIVDEVWQGESEEVPATIGHEFLISKPINAYDARLFGVELAYQRDFGFICKALKCMGFYGTYTYTHSKTRNHQFQHRQIKAGEKITLTGSPAHTANASLYFEKKGVNVRLSYNYASSFIDEMGTIASLDRYYDDTHYLDLNAGYTFGKKIKTTIYADATNLLNQPLRYYQGNKDRTMQVEFYGIRFNAGIKINL